MTGLAHRLPATSRRVELHTAPRLNQAIRDRADAEVLRLESADAATLASRGRALRQEWDIERALQLNASVAATLGLLLASRDRRFLLLPLAVFSFFAQHALQGWCPPVPVMRRLGMRTVREIERERYALKALHGDFDALPGPDTPVSERVRAALAAVDA
ncbi:hypothetical protein [Azohydromonas caseinilytica]|uniref:DUF2892 domain-containing protein n=1 Tax=Azohydromonas caseinilytica TaxID=2728836 RepID=A0A848FG09_9BURK|nr:hypothetical protein [Azohydromonas caseinilytica]NML18304.1 hypothetical protein [Azohydromonas caseinilytica]